jgi:hypothetical protein
MKYFTLVPQRDGRVGILVSGEFCFSVLDEFDAYRINFSPKRELVLSEVLEGCFYAITKDAVEFCRVVEAAQRFLKVQEIRYAVKQGADEGSWSAVICD